MSLIETNTLDIVKKQIGFKFKAYLGSLISLVTVQIIAILLSLNGVGQHWYGGSSVNINIKTYSANIILMFSIFWAFIVAITITTKTYRNIDFSFVSNRVSSHLSSLALLLIYSFIGSITAVFAGILLRVIMYFSGGNIIGDNFFIPLPELLLSIYVGTLYILLVAIVGYFIGMLVQIHKAFIFIIPAAIIGSIMLEHQAHDTFSLFIFYIWEHSLLLFSLKVLLTIAALICIIIPVTNRLEVRK